MKTYLVKIQEIEEWKTFGELYRKAGLGTNLDQAIMYLIKKFNKTKVKK